MDVRSTIDEPLTPIKRALLEIRDLRTRLAEAETLRNEPIAIVGMGVRFPGGACDAESFAQLLWSGEDAVTQIPADRWSLDALYAPDPDAPGKMTTRYGAFLAQVDRFDAEFFGISPREAASMDPQQRLLLEVSWEALEDAGHAPGGIAGTRAGVYLGIANNDYGRALFAHSELIEAYFSTGNAYSVAAGRLSYFLGLHGPSIAVDTACSSSLVALHLACQGLRLRECDLALAGGVNVILTPEMNINFSKARMMAPDGRCKTFDAAADGYVRGEGCAMVLLRRMADALSDGDRILAVIRGSAVNQDGRSGGLTAPNGPAQESVIRAALALADVPASAIGYIEAHGTGTALGDPIEVGALGAVLCPGRDAGQPLAIGSVKTNIGHLEAGAGIAGVIKVILALERREIPPHLHFHAGNPHISWSTLPITVPTAVLPWAPIGGRRLAGISSFGFSGTNAHIILEEAPAAEQAVAAIADRPRHLLALSARGPEALLDIVGRYESKLDDNTAIADACFTTNAGRTHFGHRVAVVGATTHELRRGLAAYSAGAPNLAVASGRIVGSARPKAAFLFTGQGAQYPGMGRLLYETSPVFRHALDECAVRLSSHLKPGLLEVLFSPEDATPIHDALYVQPTTFAIEYALAVLWRSWGIEPAIVLGHSLGEYAAACIAGMLSLDNALRLVVERGRLAQMLSEDGAMGAVFAAEEVVAAEVASSQGALTIAAYNGPENFVISGPRTIVASALARLEVGGVRVKTLRVPFAAHSQLVEPILPAFQQVLDTVQFEPLRIAMVSNVTGALAGLEEIGRPSYWLTHMRAPVRFASSMQTLAAQGITHFIEVGPHPVLLGIGAECIPGTAVEWLPSLRRDRTDWCDLIESLQRLYVGGADVDWNGFDRGYQRRRIALPTYPFRKSRHWMNVVGQPAAPPPGAVDRWSCVTTALQRHADQGPLDLNAASYPAKLDCLARLTSAHAIRTLLDAGLFARSGERHRLDQVLGAAGIGTMYRRLVQRWLDRLVAQGLLRAEGETYFADAPLPDPELSSLWVEAERLFADDRPLLAYVRHCGELLSQVLRGDESPLETLFPGGSFELAQDLYERSATMRYVNVLVANAFESLGACVSEGRTLRVLEVGAGTGGTTAGVLSVLPPDRTRYLFTDVSEVFLDRARQRFGNYPFLTFGRLDLDKDSPTQGYLPGSFDVVVLANVVHASTDLRLALRRLHDLLAPGGLLILVESTTHFAWFDMTTGLIEGWQHFNDDLRSDNPLLSAAKWVEALRGAGFEEADAWPQPASPAAHFGQHVLVARVADVPEEGIGAATCPDLGAHTEVSMPAERTDSFRQRVLDTLPADRLDLMRDFVRERVVQVLRLDPAEPPDRNDRLMDLGFDSLMAVQLRNLLGKDLSIERPLRATLMFDYPTINALATHLLDQLVPTNSGAIQAAQEAGKRRPPLLGTAAVAAMRDAEIETRLLERLEKQ
jgi:acyl transferase domain-containing protein/SAM-dependent methyltransferase